MKKFNSELFFSSNRNIKIDMGSMVFNALSSDNALVYNKENKVVKSCLWSIDSNGIFVLVYKTGEIDYFLLLSTDGEISVQSLIKTDGGKFKKKNLTVWRIIVDVDVDVDVDVGEFNPKKDRLLKRLNFVVILLMLSSYLIQLLFVIFINSAFSSINISSFFTILISSSLYLIMIKSNFNISETIYLKYIKKYLN